ncbi:UNVERIFIED_CONTAM: hypothetical protein Slati_1645900 [Sesamum latifolium]|uniref:Uncharacterized protein n=1 Tax=Sesamum latifolium TaxID=2727402 RepID=A0AAW2X9W3_9LAMI
MGTLAATRNGVDQDAQDFSSIAEIFKFKGAQKDNKLVKDDDKLEELERHDYWGSDEVAKGKTNDEEIKYHCEASYQHPLCSQFRFYFSALGGHKFHSHCSPSLNTMPQWTVLVVEVRPNLLSSDFERFLLKEITQVGDVILVEDENVIEYDFKLVGLETLVGYTVVTPSRQSIGKVRGYTFNINTGTVESLELDSFGISIIPSSLVSTYSLFAEDVKEVLSDTVIVQEAAVSRMQRLTKYPVKKEYFPIESLELDASLADELTAIREKLERLRIDKEKTEKMLRERGLMLDLQMKEIVERGESQKQLEMEVDRLYRLKEIKLAASMRISPLRSLRDKEEERKMKQDEEEVLRIGREGKQASAS